MGHPPAGGAPPPNDPTSIFMKWANRKPIRGPKEVPKEPPYPGTQGKPPYEPPPPDEVPLPPVLYILKLLNGWNLDMPHIMVDPSVTQVGGPNEDCPAYPCKM